MMKYLLVLLLVTTSACTTTEPKAPPLKVDYVGSGTFRWGTHEGYSLLSFTQSSVMPRIASDGTFFLDNFQLAISEDDESGRSGQVLPERYIPLAGDGGIVDFSAFTSDGRVVVTRQHCGRDYALDVLQLRREGLELIDHDRVKLMGDPEPQDIILFGKVYFEQDPNTDLVEAKHRFFRAGVHYPKLALQFLRQLEDRAEDERNAILGAEALNYRERFELLEEMPPINEENS
jgi:hypothetical protein